jgi:tetratricopeptide (TPR) repeat protein
MGNFEKAADYFEQALYIYENVLGTENKTTIRAYNNVGGCYSLLKRHQKALEFKKIALEIKVRMDGEENEDVAYNYENISFEYSSLGKDDQAFSFKEKVYYFKKFQ